MKFNNQNLRKEKGLVSVYPQALGCCAVGLPASASPVFHGSRVVGVLPAALRLALEPNLVFEVAAGKGRPEIIHAMVARTRVLLAELRDVGALPEHFRLIRRITVHRRLLEHPVGRRSRTSRDFFLHALVVVGETPRSRLRPLVAGVALERDAVALLWFALQLAAGELRLALVRLDVLAIVEVEEDFSASVNSDEPEPLVVPTVKELYDTGFHFTTSFTHSNYHLENPLSFAICEAPMTHRFPRKQKSPYFRLFSSNLMKKFSFPTENRQFRFEPKIQYELAAERSEAASSDLPFSKVCVCLTKSEPILNETDGALRAPN